jgi:hypothetical protein
MGANGIRATSALSAKPPLLRRGTMTRLVSILATSAALVALAAAVGRAQDDKKIVHNVTTERVEAILKDLGIEYKKSAGKTEGIQFYDFERNNYKIRLHNYQGRTSGSMPSSATRSRAKKSTSGTRGPSFPGPCSSRARSRPCRSRRNSTAWAASTI